MFTEMYILLPKILQLIEAKRVDDVNVSIKGV